METALTALLWAGTAAVIAVAVTAVVAIVFLVINFQKHCRDARRIGKTDEQIKDHIAAGARTGRRSL